MCIFICCAYECIYATRIREKEVMNLRKSKGDTWKSCREKREESNDIIAL